MLVGDRVRAGGLEGGWGGGWVGAIAVSKMQWRVASAKKTNVPSLTDLVASGGSGVGGGGKRNNNPHGYNSKPGRRALTNTDKLCASHRAF